MATCLKPRKVFEGVRSLNGAREAAIVKFAVPGEFSNSSLHGGRPTRHLWPQLADLRPLDVSAQRSPR